jgi:site-specific recombinase
VSFLLISAIGGLLATRQPAVTAPALAAETGALDTIDGLRALLARATALLRAQSAAVFGNLMTAVPIMAALAFAMLLIFGRPLISVEKAYATIHSLSLLGITPLFAAVTGVLLWLASLFAGFTDNWFTLRRLKESLAHHRRLIHALGAHRAERLADWLERNVAAIAGNLALAVLLGMAPVIAQFFGVPLDVRHVALSAAALMAAVGSLGWDVVTMPQFWLACAGVVSIGLLNVGVAFACALALALRARDVPKRTRRLVFRAVLQRFALRPAVFFWPVTAEAATTALPVGADALSQTEGEEERGKGEERSQ